MDKVKIVLLCLISNIKIYVSKEQKQPDESIIKPLFSRAFKNYIPVSQKLTH
jgi:hypothetical protein